MNRLLLLLLLFSGQTVVSYGQDFGLHQEASKHGCCSQRTNGPYTYDQKKAKKAFPVLEVNKVSEKSLFYEGKYDPRKAQPDNFLYEQIYLIPPGTLPIAKGHFLDQTEVANIHYLEFLHYVERDSGKTKRIEYEPRLENKYRTKYYENPELYYFPVVGVSAENAEAYCRWRAEMYNSQIKHMMARMPKKYRYEGRLPNLTEWKNAAGSTMKEVKPMSYKINGEAKSFLEEDIVPSRLAPEEILDIKEVELYNTANLNSADQLNIEIPMYIYSFEPNSKGFYNMYGNVKEILHDGHAIGGSFKSKFTNEDLFEADDVQAYRTDVGFRCICEIARRGY